MKDSVVMPVTHGDADYLPYSLFGLRDFKGEIVFVYDAPGEREREIIDNFVKNRWNTLKLFKRKLPFHCPGPCYSSYIYGSLNSTGERVWWHASDIVVNPEVFGLELRLPCKFRYVDAPGHLRHVYFSFLSNFSKSYMFRVHPKNFPYEQYMWRNEDFPAKEGDKQAVYHLYDEPHVLHLRRTRNQGRFYYQGSMRKRNKVNPVRVLLHSILFNRPNIMRGYLHG